MVNAFALPGGYVYVTRGLLALTNNEAELAGVLGHEIGHVTARHTAQRYDQAQVGQLGATASQLAGVLLGGYLGGSQGAQLGGQAAGQVGSLGAQAYVQGYSREQEFQADELGIRYLGSRRLRSRRHGHLPGGAAGRGRLPGNARRARQRGCPWPIGSASHPRTPDRVARAVERQRARGAPARADRPPGAAGGDRRDDLRRGPGPGRDPRPQLRASGAAHRLRGAPGFKLQNSPRQVAGTDGRAGTWCSTWPRAPAAICGATCRQLDPQAAPAGPAERGSRRPRGARSGSGASPWAAAPPRPCSPPCAARGVSSTASSSPIPAGSTAPTLRTFEQSLRSFRTLLARRGRGPRADAAACGPGRPGDTVDSFARRMQVP